MMQSRMCILTGFTLLSSVPLITSRRIGVAPIAVNDIPLDNLSHDTAEYRGLRRAFTDIDDTMKCSDAAIFHGIDTNCDHTGEIYPGVAQFQLEIGLGPYESSLETASRLEPPSPVPLSARPRELRRILRIKRGGADHLYFREVGQRNGFEGWSLDVEGAQYGSVRSGFSMIRRDFEAVLPRLKYEGWLNYNSSLPTVFIGDNGQGDVEAAQMMYEHDTEADGRAPSLGAFIHHVQPVPLSSDALETAWRSGHPGTERALADQSIYLFREYVHGACVAYKEGFISAAGYGRVAEGVIRECSLQPSESEHELLDPRERKICRQFKPNFKIVDGQWTPRPADECDRAFADPAPGLMDGVRPKDIVSAAGDYITGFCSDLSPSFLEGLAQAHALFAAHGRAEADVAKLAEAGMPELLYWALKEGVHCLTDCHRWGHSCDRAHSHSDALLESAWELEDTDTRTWSGFCRTTPSHICRLTPGSL